MKTLRTSANTLVMFLWLGALGMLWQTGQTEAMWVGILLLIPTAVMLFVIILNFGKMWDHPQFGGDDAAAVVRDVMGPRKDWQSFRLIGMITDLIGGAYMIYAGHELRAYGALFVAAVIVSRTLTFIDCTKMGRGLGKIIGIPLTENLEPSETGF